jgi:hypothetical protein
MPPGLGQAVDPNFTAERSVDPKDVPAGNYVLDDNGRVVLNVDGSPRKKSGRPRNE